MRVEYVLYFIRERERERENIYLLEFNPHHMWLLQKVSYTYAYKNLKKKVQQKQNRAHVSNDTVVREGRQE